MTGEEIKKMILNDQISEESLWEYLAIDFSNAIEGIISALSELMKSHDENNDLIKKLLSLLELLSKTPTDKENTNKLRTELKNLTTFIYRDLKATPGTELHKSVLRIEKIRQYLKKLSEVEKASEQIKTIENIINETRNLKVIAELIRDNPGILKIKDKNGKNILHILLKKYSSLEEDNEEEINFLYQVITLFVTSDNLDIEIGKQADSYIDVLQKRSSKHVRDVRQLLNSKKRTVSLKDLEKRYNLSLKYPSHIERELTSFKMGHHGAIDLINQPSFTIDGEEAVCLDDALYFERNSDGSYTLYVHITYIPALIPFLSKMNRESIIRAETIYLIDGAFPLYPSYISNNLASILQDQIRYTETGIWTVEPDMTLVEDSFRLVKSTIKSHHRLTYNGADEIIGAKSNDPLCQTLTDLGRFALKQRERNKTKEKYRQEENAHSNDPNRASIYTDHSVSANIVQECALLFGKSKAELYNKRGLPCIYRACGEQRRMDLSDSLIINMSPEDYNSLSRKLSYYTATPEIHHGLGYEVYCHAGSPARRSVDGLLQYIEKELLFNPNPSDKTIYIWEGRVKQLAEHYNKKGQEIEAFSDHYNYAVSTHQLIRSRKP